MRVLVTLIFIGAIIALGTMVGRGNPNPTGSPSPDLALTKTDQNPLAASTTPTISPTNTPAQGGGVPSGKLFVLNAIAGGSEIISLNTETKEKKLIYTDKNETKKIKLASTLSRNGDSLVLLTGEPDSPAGQLLAVSTDGKANKTVLADNFVATEAPAISPDQTKMALVSFSNAEPNFGFTLVLMNIDGSHRQDLATNSSGLSSPAFSPDGKQIAFLKGATTTSSEVAVVVIDTKKVSTLYSVKDKLIEDFGWSSTGLLAITAAPAGKRATNQSEVYLIDHKTKNSSQATKNSLFERTPFVALDGTGIAYIQLSADKALDLTKTGEVMVAQGNGQNPIAIGTGTAILGWAK